MKYKLGSLCVLFVLFTCAQDKEFLKGDSDWQREMNANFKDASKSPLKDKDRKNFKGLDFYPTDSSYVIVANLTRTPEAKPFKMKTTTDRLPDYVKYGIVKFELNGKSFELDIFQNLELLKKEGYEDYLFLPFLDDTNGDATYGGGRYVECSIPNDNKIIINFNQAYNPYCAYNERYSCPIVPRGNYLNTAIEAGVKSFAKN